MKIFIYLTLSYFCGAVPFAYIVAKIFGKVDIRTLGSGNPGATNVFRSISKKLGIFTLLLDAAKGFVPVYFASAVSSSVYFVIAVALITVIGHMYTVFLNFKGGKGVATGCGVFAAIAPLVTLICFCTFLIVLFISQYVSLASMCAAAVLSVLMFAFGYPAELSVFAVIISLLVIIRHTGNIKRIVAGNENKIILKKLNKKEV